MADLANALFVSTSTIYRIVNNIEIVLERHFDISISKNPVVLIGSEKKIRYFYYQYFNEKYKSPDEIFALYLNQSVWFDFLLFFLEFTEFDADFAYFNVYKLVATVNLLRYKQGYRIDVSNISINFDEIIPNLGLHKEHFKEFEQIMEVPVKAEAINQIFTPYVQSGYSLNYERLLEKVETEPELAKRYNIFNRFLDRFSSENDIPLENKTAVILDLCNAVHLEYQEPRSGYILYNRNQLFAQSLYKIMPTIHEQLYRDLKEIRRSLGISVTEEGIEFLLYIIVTWWENFIPEIYNKYHPIKVLVISNRHITHSRMIRDLLQQRFTKQLAVKVYDKMTFDLKAIEQSDYEIIVTTFPMKAIPDKQCVYIDHIPTFADIHNIQIAIDTINESLYNVNFVT